MKRVIIESPYAPRAPQPSLPLQATPADCACVYEPHFIWCELCVKHEGEWDAWFEALNRNLSYARAAMKDCLLRNEAPFVSHLLYTQDGVLDDTVPEERSLGILAGFAYRDAVEVSVVYTDLGISKGMQAGIDDAIAKGRPVEYRSLPQWAL